jgi:rod shape determining protein RodA
MQKNPTIGKGIDWLLVWLYVILVAIGLLCIFSVEYRTTDGILDSFLGFRKNYSKQLVLFRGLYLIGSFHPAHR